LTTLILAGQDIDQKNINQTRPLVIKNLIELRLKQNEINKYQIKVEEKEIINNLNLISGNNLETFKNKFSINNLDYTIYKKDLEIELAWRKLIYSLYKDKVNIDDTEVNLQLNEVLKKNKDVDYRLIELSVPFENIKDMENKIKEINQEIKESDFETVLKKYSQSTNTSNIGDLGWVSSSSLSKNIFENIKNLEVNEISPPIILGNNLLFLKIRDKRDVKVDKNNIKNLRRKILENKKNQRFKLYSINHLSKLRSLAVVEYQ